MLVLTFRVGPTRFALPARQVRQVVPRVPLCSVAGLPAEIAGLLELGEDMVPVVDLGLRLRGTACADRLGTRIIISRTLHDDRETDLGLIAEEVTDLHMLDLHSGADRWDDNMRPGGMVRVRGVLMQWLDVERLLTSETRERVYHDLVAGRS